MRLRTSLRVLRAGSVLLAVLGLFFLYLWARHRDVPVVRVAEVSETMSMAYVRLEGAAGRVSVMRDAKGRAESVQFDLDDGTAVARVRAFGHSAAALDAAGKIPARGDRVKAAGTVRVGADGDVALLVQTAEHVEVSRAEVRRLRLSAVGPAMAGQIVEVEGAVASVRRPREGSRAPFAVVLRDEEDSAELTVWPRTWPDVEARGLREGVRCVARVTVGERRGAVQLTLEEGADLAVEGAASPAGVPAAPEAPGEALTPAGAGRGPLGRLVRVRGTVERIEPPPADSKKPGRVVLAGGGGTLVLVAWKEAFREFATGKLAQGDEVEVSGTLEEFKGERQLKLERAADLSVVSRARPAEEDEEGGEEEDLPADEAPLPGAKGEGSPAAEGVLKPGLVTRDLKGRVVVVEGTVEKSSRQKSGRRVTLADGGATLVVFLKNPVAKGVAGLASLGKGARVRVRGTVDEHRGTLEVLPAEAGDFVVLEHAFAGAAEGKAPENRKASSLGKKDVGRFVVLEGALVSVQPIPKGTRAVLDDGSGATVPVVVWDSVKQKMKDPAVLAERRRIRVAGKVGEYKGELQVVPEEGWDVAGLD
jgi:DNA/RNA endonuclease YhcR with UshA esterase domain